MRILESIYKIKYQQFSFQLFLSLILFSLCLNKLSIYSIKVQLDQIYYCPKSQIAGRIQYLINQKDLINEFSVQPFRYVNQHQHSLPFVLHLVLSIQLIISYMTENIENINLQNIIQAFQIIVTPNSNHETIKLASNFLRECEQKPFICSALLRIHGNSNDTRIQLQTILLLTNIIKRNWSNKRNVKGNNMQSQKPHLRTAILQTYHLHQMKYSKHINQVLRYLVRIDYPNNYQEIHIFLINSLRGLLEYLSINQNVQEIINSQKLIRILSTCKVIIKEYSLKKVSQNQNDFLKYIKEAISISLQISEKLHTLFLTIIKNSSSTSIINLIECLKKIDKVILYGLGSMPLLYQYNNQISIIVFKMIEHVGTFQNYLSHFAKANSQISQQVQKYLTGVLQQIARVQNYYPFVFSNYLSEYLALILNMLLQNISNSKIYTLQKLISTIVQINLKPFTTFAYYMNEQQFKQSIYARKNNDFDNTQIQKLCHSKFRQIFTSENIPLYLSKIITEVMNCHQVNGSQKQITDQLVLEDFEASTYDNLSEPTIYEHCIMLCKNMIKCFKNDVKGIINNLFQTAINIRALEQSEQSKKQILANTMQIILILPSIYDETDLPLNHIYGLLTVLYQFKKFEYLARLIRKYHQYLNSTSIQNSFDILTNVVSTPINQDGITAEAIYQCALALKFMLSNHEFGNFSFQNIGRCIKNIVSILTIPNIMSAPPHLWPLITLLIKLIKQIPRDMLASSINQAIITGIYPIIIKQKNQQLIVCALTELIANIIQICFPFFKSNCPFPNELFQPQALNNERTIFLIFHASYLLIKNNLKNVSLQNYDNLHRLWLTSIRCYPTLAVQHFQKITTLNELNQLFKQLLNQNYQQLVEQDPVIFIQIIEQYFLIGLIDLTEGQVLKTFDLCLSKTAEDKRVRSVMALLLLYFSFCNTKPIIYDILIFMIKQLSSLMNKISPHVNSLRTLILFIFDHHIICGNSSAIYELLTNSFQNNYVRWFYPYIWSLQFVSNKFAYKINAVAILKTIKDIGVPNYTKLLVTPIDQNYPIDILLKVMPIDLESIKKQLMLNSYNNMIKTTLPNDFVQSNTGALYRKVKRHTSSRFVDEVIHNDFRNNFKESLLEIMNYLNWGYDDIEERIGKSNAQVVINILKGKNDSSIYSLQEASK